MSLTRLAEDANVSGVATELATLPTGKLASVQLYEKRLHCPSLGFFRFVATVEKVCESLFLERSVRVYGPGIVSNVCMVLEEEPAVTTAVKVCLPDLTPECLAETTSYSVSTYLNM